jgi:alkanesulfonate monooxygenase SsuD/methylene tetrahydromethanopterin reductase-like flavin-dependent oxidoreductase (luciferase family)
MDFHAQYAGSAERTAEEWAQDREGEGWAGVSTVDHVTQSGRGWPHLSVTLTRFVAATRRLRVSAAYGNNLVRSPVEFAHLALSLQDMSGGRHDAALGSGWDRDEITAMGLPFPSPALRARRYYEAVVIVRSLLTSRSCDFDGEFYNVHIADVGPQVATPPRLAVSLAGKWTIRNIAPLVDRVELAAPGPENFLRGGTFEMSKLAGATPARFREAVEQVRDVNPAVPIWAGVFVAVGDDDSTLPFSRLFAGTMFEGLAGSPSQVAETLHRFKGDGVTGMTVMPMLPGSIERLGPALPS